ncbi:PIN domain-containing protein [Pseudarthrobacter sp. NIBRBAC000502771]|uniref:PIN domain-containing protein n=1 Tax=Pseudarthrobacter sp. NIBRBAC000502771 TaxID=2590774 RepID=UPI0011308AEB|nr:PIN domain-containing protein [Pseudarthrobacter sp. NIBRBAC000502771]QDG63225.1 hypothetical protein NIBR502771_13425 [Pseudarthrobacter sp. NIBRBAC000502771]
MMREIYEALMPLPEGNFEFEFGRAVIVLDTNVMLDMYRFSRPTSQRFLELLEHVVDRLWLPYQVGLEFLRRRASVRDDLTANHGARIDELSKLVNKFESAEKKSHVGHDKAEAEFIAATKKYLQFLTKERDDVRAWAKSQHEDQVLSAFQDYYRDRTGSRPTAEWLSQRTAEGEKRYKSKTPPGYEDSAKESNQYGDYFLWRQCIEHCGAEQRPLLFVTGDVKQDWWQTGRDKKRLGPRLELVEEFFDETGQHLFMLDTSQFFERLRTTVEASVTEDLEASDAAQTEIDAAQAQRELRARPHQNHSFDMVWRSYLAAEEFRKADEDANKWASHILFDRPRPRDSRFVDALVKLWAVNPQAFEHAVPDRSDREEPNDADSPEDVAAIEDPTDDGDE